MNIDYFKTERIVSRLPSPIFPKLTSIPTIRHKIRLGFFLTLGMMAFGVITGKVVADRTAAPFHEKLTALNEQGASLTTLQIEFIRINTDQKELLYGQVDFATSTRYHERILNNLKKIESLIDNLIERHTSSKLNTDINNYNYNQLINILPLYKTLVIEYRQLLKLAMGDTNPKDIKFEDSLVISQNLKRTMTSPTAFELDRMSQQIGNSLLDIQADNKKLMAEVERVETIEFYIYFVCFLISLIAASMMALRISGAIATPLEDATIIAQKFAETEDENLRVPVTTGDETGKLATALNQLIERVSNSTYQLKQAQSQLIQSEKMSGLGQMVAGVAHEVNNPVNFIHGNLQHIQEYTEELLQLVQLYQTTYPAGTPEINHFIEGMDLEFLQQDLPKILASMRLGTERIRNLVLSLRNFSRLDEAEVKNVDIHEGLRSTLLILSHRLQGKVQVVENFGELSLIDCYPSQLNQVFINIIGNAIDSFPTTQSDRKITITTKQLAHQQVQIRIRDNGVGIPPEVRSRIFDPFFTTKPIGQGTGLGLSISYQIIEKHRGMIQLNSQVSYGTEFVINLPVSFSTLA